MKIRMRKAYMRTLPARPWRCDVTDDDDNLLATAFGITEEEVRAIANVIKVALKAPGTIVIKPVEAA